MSEANTQVGRSIENPDHVFRDDDTNPEVAGLGLAFAPMVGDIVGNEIAYWMMAPAEQAAMVYLLQALRPKIVIEIGTRFGGSLQLLAKYSEKVYSLDIDPDVLERLGGKHPNVEFRIGPSTETLPILMKELEEAADPVSFVLIDGDHTATGVAADVDNVLQYRPRGAMYVVMHDSFNPECRKGLRMAKWAASPYVHVVELDFVPGIVNPAPAFRGELWGGLALGVLRPERRTGALQITGRSELTYQRSRPLISKEFVQKVKGKLMSLTK